LEVGLEMNNWFRVSWRVALQLAIVIPFIIFGGMALSRWTIVYFEDIQVPHYLIAPTTLIEAQVVKRGLEKIPREYWQTELDALNDFYKGDAVLRLVPMKDLNDRSLMAPDVREALDKGRPVITRLSITRPNLLSQQFILIPSANQFLVIDIKPKAFYSGQELSFMNHAREIILAERTLVVLSIIAVCLFPFFNQALKLMKATKEYEGANFGYRTKMSRLAPMYPIAKALNNLAARVAALMESHRSLVNAAAHELRTPLTRLRYAQRMALASPSHELQKTYLERIDKEAIALDELVSEILFYARLDRMDEGSRDIQSIDGQQWISTEVKTARIYAAAIGRDVTITFSISVNAVQGNIESLNKLIRNLLNNAVRYANGHVRVELFHVNGLNHLVVEDDGPGIPIADRDRVFEPFARLEDPANALSDNSMGAGTGIGLAIVARVAAWHGGRANIEDSSLHGTRVVTSWPDEFHSATDSTKAASPAQSTDDKLAS
jgi:signal transduction histidine kinase